nr:CD151 antigen-like isoform X1 [Onthophagus taurus]XP_022913452.1 CD151 antigen-like isoform X1 [Onthophagus taurus]
MATENKEGCCTYPFLKSLLRVFNFIFLITGIGIIAISVWTLIDKFNFVTVLSTINYQLITYTLLLAGCLVIFASFLGCLAINKSNKPMLLTYIFLLALIFLIEAMVGILGFIYLDSVKSELDKNLNETFLTTYQYDEAKTQSIDFIQKEFKCCGAMDFEDWQRSKWKTENSSVINKVPDSCCKTLTEHCGIRDHPSNIYYDPCFFKIEELIILHLSNMSAVGLGISILQIFGIIFGCCLFCHIKDDYGERI